MLSRPNQTEPTRSKPEAKPDHPDLEKINNLSTEISTKGSFRIFGCCFKPDDPQQSGFFSKMFLPHPTSAMASNKTKKSPDLVDIFDPPPLEIDPPIEYPVDKVFILGDAYKIVAKITVKKVLKQASILHQGSIINRRRGNESLKGLGPGFRKSTMYHNERDRGMSRTSRIDSTILEEDIPLEVKKEIFSQFEKGIKAEKWQEITPEKVAIHVADRLRCDVLIDALCGIGGNTIQFARTCNYVIGIDIQDLKTTWARHNARVYKIHHKIDFITGDFMRIRNITGDVVFLGPAYERDYNNPDEPFSIFKHVQPDPLTLLAKSLEVSYKIALQLPGDTQLEELPHLFNESLEKYGSYSKRFCIEIEKIVNSFNETECIMIYFGDCSSISIREEYEAIYEYISRNEVPEWREEFPLQVITAIVQKVGILRTFKFISRIEAQYAEKDLVVISLFDAFLKKVIQENVLTKAYVEKLIEEADRKAEWAHVNVNLHPNTYNSPIIPTFSQKAELESHNKNSKNIEASPLKAAKPTGLLSRLVTGPGQGPVIEKVSGNSVQKKGIGLMSSEEVSPTQFSVQEFQGTFKDSYEISDLPVSSYSVSSDYLMDFSEDEVQSRKMTDMNDSCRDIGGDFSGRNRDRNSVKSRFSRSPKYSDEERKQRMEKKLKGEIDENRKSLQIPRRQSKDVFRSVTNRNEEIGSKNRLSFLLEGCDDF